jgi:hypothetical protein
MEPRASTHDSLTPLHVLKGLSLAVYVNKDREWLVAVGQTMLPAPASPAAPVI